MQTGKVVEENKIHDAAINDLQLSTDGTHFVTASNDKTAKLVETSTLEELKVYQTERNANSAALSPIEDHVSCSTAADMSGNDKHKRKSLGQSCA